MLSSKGTIISQRYVLESKIDKMSTIQYFNGLKFTLDKSTGYYKHSNILMHRYVWEYYNTKIPDGYEIHHKDFDRGNNDICNLQLLSCSEHKKLHGLLLTDEQREWRRQNLTKNVRPKASEWHKSDEGREWHKEHIKEQRGKGVFTKSLVCTNCGKIYTGESKNGNTFCCNACKSAYRRKIGADLIPAVCVYCGKRFQTNKFRPSRTCSRSCTNRQRAIDNRRGH